MMVVLSACATSPAPEPKIQAVEVKTEVPISCVPSDLPPPPAYTDTTEALKAAPDFAARYQLLAANRGLRITREAMLESLVAGCLKAGGTK